MDNFGKTNFGYYKREALPSANSLSFRAFSGIDHMCSKIPYLIYMYGKVIYTSPDPGFNFEFNVALNCMPFFREFSFRTFH